MEHDMDEKDTVVVVAHNKMDACSSVGEVVVVVDSKEEENDDNIHKHKEEVVVEEVPDNWNVMLIDVHNRALTGNHMADRHEKVQE